MTLGLLFLFANAQATTPEPVNHVQQYVQSTQNQQTGEKVVRWSLAIPGNDPKETIDFRWLQNGEKFLYQPIHVGNHKNAYDVQIGYDSFAVWKYKNNGIDIMAYVPSEKAAPTKRALFGHSKASFPTQIFEPSYGIESKGWETIGTEDVNGKLLMKIAKWQIIPPNRKLCLQLNVWIDPTKDGLPVILEWHRAQTGEHSDGLVGVSFPLSSEVYKRSVIDEAVKIGNKWVAKKAHVDLLSFSDGAVIRTYFFDIQTLTTACPETSFRPEADVSGVVLYQVGKKEATTKFDLSVANSFSTQEMIQEADARLSTKAEEEEARK